MRGQLRKRVRTAKGRKLSSTRWLERQLNDQYVARAKSEGFRARSAYKLMEINNKYRIIRPDMLVLDLGCTPGGWCQVAKKAVGNKGRVVGVDINPMQDIKGVKFVHLDFLAANAPEILLQTLAGNRPDLLLSDMAPPTTGLAKVDHLRIIALCEAAAEFAFEVLKTDGTFLAKVLQGGADSDLLARLKRRFAKVRHVKPKASRPESAETYLLATGFRGSTST